MNAQFVARCAADKRAQRLGPGMPSLVWWCPNLNLKAEALVLQLCWQSQVGVVKIRCWQLEVLASR